MLTNLSEGDIRLLRKFANVVGAGGFSAARIALNISYSTSGSPPICLLLTIVLWALYDDVGKGIT
jgi:hypothetical protein